MLRKLKRSPSLFIATTRNEMTLVSLDNESGQVWLEWLDSGRRLVLAPSLPAFWAAGDPAAISGVSHNEKRLADRQGVFVWFTAGLSP